MSAESAKKSPMSTGQLDTQSVKIEAYIARLIAFVLTVSFNRVRLEASYFNNSRFLT